MKYTCLLVLFIVFSVTVTAQNGAPIPKSLSAYKIVDVQIILDGKLNESFWDQIEGSEGFLMQEPVEGSEPTERTVIKIAYDEAYIYIGVTLYDSDPGGIKSFQKKRDASLSTDDRFMWILDTFLDGRNAYFFEINPGG